MKFISQTGTEVKWKSPSRLAKRMLSFSFENKSTWTEDDFLNIVWKHAGLLCEYVQLVSVYRPENEKWIGHAYELAFQTGPGLSLNTRRDVNDLVADIESDAVNTLGIALRGVTHRPKELATNRELNTFGQEK